MDKKDLLIAMLEDMERDLKSIDSRMFSLLLLALLWLAFGSLGLLLSGGKI